MPFDTLRTPLHALHLRHGARMVPFAGYAMPVQYPEGLLREHLHTRAQAGLFDVSHMGQIQLIPRTGNLVDAARALETLLPIDVLGLQPGRQRYGLLLDETGGIRDDLMVAHCGDTLVLVVNAANKLADEAYLRAHLTGICEIAVLPRALLALQGPGAETALARLAPEVAAMRFMDVRTIELAGTSALVTRSGYTGEDGFEISVPEDRAEGLAEALLADVSVRLVGLGARDSLRLEAGLCLHGADIDAGTDPVEAGLGWSIPAVRRRGGAREGGFPGAAAILAALAAGPTRRRVGLRTEGAAPVRAGALLFAEEAAGDAIGRITSGGFGPSLQAPVAMGYLPVALTEPGTRVFAEVRGRRLPMVVNGLPFVPAGFKRA
ncbi:Aminomethyltransferase [Methylobacterium adhaesivum]|uniref:aminomethyltransferase n=1 Tax=Methylobacterium adhaesivum TaxID=333297 RepID=A0ABT8BLB5_9HYPH|nr:glycine cleavage system aminomethyltransferase GcvT [Methylobacterium adhaesivum]MDN3592921.1 glycine cleavage system aminomethyltransferase GcvT [Methylobacterium adhaesivum]GJD31702.1 Aminomethyltransferase [Methylobacterium adhaesivum]